MMSNTFLVELKNGSLQQISYRKRWIFGSKSFDFRMGDAEGHDACRGRVACGHAACRGRVACGNPGKTETNSQYLDAFYNKNKENIPNQNSSVFELINSLKQID